MWASLAGGDGAPGIGLAFRMLRVPDQRTCARISGREQKNVREEERPHMMPAPACVMRPCDVPVRSVRSDHTTQKLRHGFLLRVTGCALVLPLRPWWASGFSSLWGMSSGGGPDSAMKRDRLVYVTTSY